MAASLGLALEWNVRDPQDPTVSIWVAKELPEEGDTALDTVSEVVVYTWMRGYEAALKKDS